MYSEIFATANYFITYFFSFTLVRYCIIDGSFLVLDGQILFLSMIKIFSY